MILLFVWQTIQAQTIEDKLSFLVEPKVQHEAEVRTPSSLALIRQELKQQYLLAQKLIEKGSTEEECEDLPAL